MNILKLDAFFEKKSISLLTVKQIKSLKLSDWIFNKSASEKEIDKVTHFVDTHIAVGNRHLSPGSSYNIEESDYGIDNQNRIVFFREQAIGYTTTIRKLEQFVKSFPDWKLSFEDGTTLEIHSGGLTTKVEIDCDNTNFYEALITEDENVLNLLFVNISFLSSPVNISAYSKMFCNLVKDLNVETVEFLSCMYDEPYIFYRDPIYNSAKNSNILFKSSNPRFQKMLNSVGW